MDKTLESLIKCDETVLENTMLKFLTQKYGETNIFHIKNHFILALGALPIGLVAHMDTVVYPKVEKIKEKNGIVSAKYGLGADDRAGIYAIVKLIQKGYRPTIIFTNQEEVGGLGAKALSMCLEDLRAKYLIQLDRRGKDDAVFYDCPNKKFKDYVCGFGFTEQTGIYSDISFLCPVWDIAGVNLSVGYFYEHTEKECLNLEYLEETIVKVEKMLKEEKTADYFNYWEE